VSFTALGWYNNLVRGTGKKLQYNDDRISINYMDTRIYGQDWQIKDRFGYINDIYDERILNYITYESIYQKEGYTYITFKITDWLKVSDISERNKNMQLELEGYEKVNTMSDVKRENKLCYSMDSKGIYYIVKIPLGMSVKEQKEFINERKIKIFYSLEVNENKETIEEFDRNEWYYQVPTESELYKYVDTGESREIYEWRKMEYPEPPRIWSLLCPGEDWIMSGNSRIENKYEIYRKEVNELYYPVSLVIDKGIISASKKYMGNILEESNEDEVGFIEVGEMFIKDVLFGFLPRIHNGEVRWPLYNNIIDGFIITASEFVWPIVKEVYINIMAVISNVEAAINQEINNLKVRIGLWLWEKSSKIKQFLGDLFVNVENCMYVIFQKERGKLNDIIQCYFSVFKYVNATRGIVRI